MIFSNVCVVGSQHSISLRTEQKSESCWTGSIIEKWQVEDSANGGDDLLVGILDTCLNVFLDSGQLENSVSERLQCGFVGHQLLSSHVRQIINQRRIRNVHPRELWKIDAHWLTRRKMYLDKDGYIWKGKKPGRRRNIRRCRSPASPSFADTSEPAPPAPPSSFPRSIPAAARRSSPASLWFRENIKFRQMKNGVRKFEMSILLAIFVIFFFYNLKSIKGAQFHPIIFSNNLIGSNSQAEAKIYWYMLDHHLILIKKKC